MMTREEIAAIDRECEQHHISQQDYLEESRNNQASVLPMEAPVP